MRIGIGNYSVCPIVFNVFERLKVELGPASWSGGDDYLDYW
jgi:hypothetical protein